MKGIQILFALNTIQNNFRNNNVSNILKIIRHTLAKDNSVCTLPHAKGVICPDLNEAHYCPVSCGCCNNDNHKNAIDYAVNHIRFHSFWQ
ncbi:hypothetical protein DPMN_048125 [Dreissena polymorpha]|uniref:Uncharacterized protein n=1 Tax=Dreissena polymorpha TaxID=45954 RepID=A0A9D4HZT9_DREPO|nr:hypothetical protein DPMN_048125 [Dreissena polymorpha]